MDCISLYCNFAKEKDTTTKNSDDSNKKQKFNADEMQTNLNSYYTGRT